LVEQDLLTIGGLSAVESTPYRYRHSGRRGAQRLGDPEPSGAEGELLEGAALAAGSRSRAPLGSGLRRNDDSGEGALSPVNWQQESELLRYFHTAIK
jgi:hypothetical protein